MTSEQLKAAGMILAKVVPDLSRVDSNVTGGAQTIIQILQIGDNPDALEKLRLQMKQNSVKTITHEQADDEST